MPSFIPILIGTSYIGGSTEVQVVESNGTGSLNQLLATVGNEKYIIDSFEIWTDNIDQLMQPIALVRLSPDGNYKNFVVIPQKSIYQFQNVLKKIETNNFPLDENTRINYNILPNANVKLTLNINKSVRKDNSLTKVLEQMGSKSIRPEIMQELGFREPEEIDELKKKKQTAKDKEYIQAVGKIMQPRLLRDVNMTKKLIIAGLVLIAGSSVLYALTNGAAPILTNKKLTL